MGLARCREVVESADRVACCMGPGVPLGQVQDDAACGAGGDGEWPMPVPFGFPAARVVVGEGEGLHPGGDVQGEGDEGAAVPVLREPVQRQIT